jgi:uncharacterized membrane protein YhaH (DUF805 family)
MTSPTGSDQNYPQGGASGGQPGWGTPAPGGYSPAPSYAGASAGPMSLPDAVRSVLTQYANFSGRARRSEYWWFVLAYFIAYVVAALIDQMTGVPVLTLVLVLGLLVPTLAVSVRRLHDTDRSGWWLLLNLIPFGGIVTLVFSCLDSQPGANRFGPSPKYQAAGGYQGV